MPITVLEPENRKHCKSCPLNGRGKNTCLPTEINVNENIDHVDVLVVASNASEVDDRIGRILVGPSGHMVRQSLPKKLVVAYTSAVRCYAGGNKEEDFDAPSEAVERCANYLRKDIERLRPRLVIAIGDGAAKSLGLSGDNDRAATLRKRPIHRITLKEKTYSVMVTLNLADAEFNPTLKPVVQTDLSDRVGRLLANKAKFLSRRGQLDGVEFRVVDTIKDLKRMIRFFNEELGSNELLALDYETLGFGFRRDNNQILTAAFASTGNENLGWGVPLAHPETPFSAAQLEEVYYLLGEFLMSPTGRFHGFLAHHAQFEHLLTRAQFGNWIGRGVNRKPTLDTEQFAFLLDENRREYMDEAYTLETLVMELLGFTWYADTGIKNERDKLAEQPLDKVLKYNTIDSIMTGRLFNELYERAQAENFGEQMLRIGELLYSDTIRFAASLRRNGLKIDIDYLQELRKPKSIISGRLVELKKMFTKDKDIKRAEKKLNADRFEGEEDIPFGDDVPSEVFDMNKAAHRQVLFFDVLKLKPLSHGKNGPSADKAFQNAYEKTVPVIAAYKEYQQLAKLDQAYLKPIAQFLSTDDCADGRVHPSFHLSSVVTGRSSASHPNSQQQPRGKTVAQKAIKNLYSVEEDHLLVEIDYSQAEVRWLGNIAGDRGLAKRYTLAEELKAELLKNPSNKKLEQRLLVDGDIHMATALAMFKLPMDYPITNPKEAEAARQKAKAICFGLIYGKGSRSLAQELGIEEEEAKKAIALWMRQFKEAGDWLYGIEDFVQKHGYVESPLGRRRRLPGVWSDDMGFANRCKRQARNTPVQSAASDTNFYAACRLLDALEKSDSKKLRKVKLVNSVHDAIYAEVHVDVVAEYFDMAKGIFTNPKLLKKDFGVTMTVPMAIDAKIGPRWGTMWGYNQTPKSLRQILHDSEVARKYGPSVSLDDLKAKGLLFDAKYGKAAK